MSLLTRCPACTTIYRVVPDQLRISEGWVKCGQCGDIFDASLHLIELPEGQESSLDVLVDGVGEGADEQLTELPDSDGVVVDGAVAGLMPDTTSPDQELPATDEQLAQQLAEAEPFGAAAPIDEPLRDHVSATNLQDDAPNAAVRWDDGPGEQDVNLEASATVSDSDQELSFMQERNQSAFWVKPVVRVGLALVSMFLVLTLLAQWVYFERSRLAVMQPDLKPFLAAACELVGCDLQPLKIIDAMVIESAAFTALDKDSYRLSFAVKNTDTVPVAIPDVELTLTDFQEQIVYRRVFSTQDLNAATELAPGTTWPVAVNVRVDPSSGSPRVLGYRLLAFYP